MDDYKIAVIGDIHSNYIGFKRCIDHALERKVDEFLFLGDYISDCPYPQKTMQIVYDMKESYPCTFIRGNREDYMLNHRKNKEERWTYCSASGSLLYTYENLTDKDFEFFESIGIEGYYEKEGYQPFRYCHGSLTKSNGMLLPDDPGTKQMIENLDVDLLVSGHTHIQETVICGKKKIVHPGAVGVSWYHNGKTQYMILHGSSKGWQEEFFQLDYDVEKIVEEFKASGLDKKAMYWSKITIHTLRTGQDTNEACLKYAMRLCREETGSVNWPDIPEKYWKMAVEKFGITD